MILAHKVNILTHSTIGLETIGTLIICGLDGGQYHVCLTTSYQDQMVILGLLNILGFGKVYITFKL